jgi:hypothetical protein
MTTTKTTKIKSRYPRHFPGLHLFPVVLEEKPTNAKSTDQTPFQCNGEIESVTNRWPRWRSISILRHLPNRTAMSQSQRRKAIYSIYAYSALRHDRTRIYFHLIATIDTACCNCRLCSGWPRTLHDADSLGSNNIAVHPDGVEPLSDRGFVSLVRSAGAHH